MRHQYNSDSPRSIVRRIYLWIDPFIRSHKYLVLGFVVTLLIVTAFAVKSTYFVPICQARPSIKVVNESVRESWLNRVPTALLKSMAKAENIYFKQYVANISKIFPNKINNIDRCKQAANGKPQVELVFVYRPLISDGIKPFDFEWNKTDPTRKLDSPWVKIAINKSPNPSIRAAFIWSERQYLLDQVLLSGMSVTDTKPPMPLDESTFTQYGRDYINTAFALGTTVATAQANLSKRLPADILWLLHHGVASIGALTKEESMRATEFLLERERVGYAELTAALLDEFFTSSTTEIRYDNILDLKNRFNIKNLLDLKDTFSLEKYQINSLFRIQKP
jgi:hypothetical protein